MAEFVVFVEISTLLVDISDESKILAYLFNLVKFDEKERGFSDEFEGECQGKYERHYAEPNKHRFPIFDEIKGEYRYQSGQAEECLSQNYHSLSFMVL